MKKIIKSIVLTFALAMFTTSAYAADEYPFMGDDYWEITGAVVR
ncbi:MAG: hypothetical protein ACI9WC_000243 [Arenicella sp.]|jgi:hypothetical protein